MVTIDERTGSVDLLAPLAKLGVPCQLGFMEYGDVAFEGNGPGGCPVTIGIEFKLITDVLKCIIDGRFTGHQLPGLVASYQYAWLLVEGDYRGDMHSGILQLKQGRGYWHNANLGGRNFMYRDLQSWFNTIDMRGGIRIARTYNRVDTIFWLAALHHWWTDKEFEEHKSHLAQRDADADRSILIKPSLLRRVASCLDGVGSEKSKAVCSQFASVRAMVLADESEWAKVEGIGKTLSKRIVEQIRKGE